MMFLIHDFEKSRIEHDVVINPPAYANPVEFVSKIADNLILKIVNNVCQDLVQKLVQAELKSFLTSLPPCVHFVFDEYE